MFGDREEDAVPAVKIRKDEMEIVRQAVTRVERRSNSRFVMDQTRVEVTDDDPSPPALEDQEDDSTPPALFE